MSIVSMLIFGEKKQAIEELNKNWKKTVIYSIWKVLDESMSYYFPQTTNNGDIPNISLI